MLLESDRLRRSGFEPAKYGFGLAHDSDLTRPLTVEVIGAEESGYVARVRLRCFGNDP